MKSNLATPDFPLFSQNVTPMADIATLPWSYEGYRNMLIIVNLFSKYMEVVIMRDLTGESLRRAVEQGWVYRYGIPDVPF